MTWTDTYRDDFAQVRFNVSGDVQSSEMQLSEGYGDNLMDEGRDLLSYQPLLYDSTHEVTQPDAIFKDASSVTEWTLWTHLMLTPIHNGRVQPSSFNVSIPLVKQRTTESLTQRTCRSYDGLWTEPNTCRVLHIAVGGVSPRDTAAVGPQLASGQRQ